MCNFSMWTWGHRRPRPFCVFWLDLVPLRWKFWGTNVGVQWTTFDRLLSHRKTLFVVLEAARIPVLSCWIVEGSNLTKVFHGNRPSTSSAPILTRSSCKSFERTVAKTACPLNFDVSQNMASRCVPFRKLDMTIWLEILRLGKIVFARIQFLYAIEFTYRCPAQSAPMTSMLTQNINVFTMNGGYKVVSCCLTGYRFCIDFIWIQDAAKAGGSTQAELAGKRWVLITVQTFDHQYLLLYIYI